MTFRPRVSVALVVAGVAFVVIVTTLLHELAGLSVSAGLWVTVIVWVIATLVARSYFRRRTV